MEKIKEVHNKHIFLKNPVQELRHKHQRIFWSKDDLAMELGKPKKSNY
jgi:hypothetical protein